MEILTKQNHLLLIMLGLCSGKVTKVQRFYIGFK